uniref:CBS domain-containing protein n=1 Tax=Trichuris muris TaxID=70415 RepID=A0A5S6Q7G4_TRIMR
MYFAFLFQRMIAQQFKAKGREAISLDSSEELSFSVSAGGGGGANGCARSHSPGLHLGNLLNRFRQRTLSESTGEPTPLDSAVSDVSSAFSTKMTIVSEEGVVSEDSGCSNPRKLFPDEDDMDVSPQSRIRSRSEASQFLVLRKMSRPNAAEIVGRLDADEKPVYKILTMFTCYDLMGKQNSVLVIDTHLTMRQALGALLSNGALSALMWDDERRATVSVMTITDLLGVMLANNDDLVNWLDCQLKEWIFEVPKGSASPKTTELTCVNGTAKVLMAVEILCRLRLHRIPVIDPETKNVLFMLTLRNILCFLHKYLSSLPLPPEMYRPIDQWNIGTWTGIHHVCMNTAVNEALDRLLKNNISSMPIVTMEKEKGDDGEDEVKEYAVVVDILTKVDIVNFIAKHGWKNLAELTVEQIVSDRPNTVEQLVTCHRSTPLLLAVDHMVRHGAHRLIIVGSKSHLVGVISIADLLCSLVPSLSGDK